MKKRTESGQLPPDSAAESGGSCPDSVRFLYGTSSWSEKSWKGVFYPAGTKPGDYLTYYATQFDTVEADNTYYAIPAPKLVEGWKRKTPEGFTLSAKFPRSIVHGGDGPRPNGERALALEHVHRDLDEYLSVMSLLGSRCGPLVIQLPYFNRSAFPNLEAFLERLEPFLDALFGRLDDG